MTVKNLAEFNRGLDNFVKKLVPEQLVLFHRKLVLDISVGAILLTPVDTGRARGGWQTTVGNVTDADNGRSDPSGNAAIQEAQEAASKIKPFDVVFVQNNVEYIGFLENGTPRMPAVGMLRRTLLRIGSVFPDAEGA